MIMLVVEKNNRVWVYDDNKKLIMTIQGKLYNYTDKIVSIDRNADGKIIDIYNDKGEKICSYPYDFDMENIKGIYV